MNYFSLRCRCPDAVSVGTGVCVYCPECRHRAWGRRLWLVYGAIVLVWLAVWVCMEFIR